MYLYIADHETFDIASKCLKMYSSLIKESFLSKADNGKLSASFKKTFVSLVLKFSLKTCSAACSISTRLTRVLLKYSWAASAGEYLYTKEKKVFNQIKQIFIDIFPQIEKLKIEPVEELKDAAIPLYMKAASYIQFKEIS